MALKITIVLEDSESGHVKLTTVPDTQTLVKIARGEKDQVSPATAYAMKAVSSIMRDSVEQGQKEGIIPQGKIQPLWRPSRRIG